MTTSETAILLCDSEAKALVAYSTYDCEYKVCTAYLLYRFNFSFAALAVVDWTFGSKLLDVGRSAAEKITNETKSRLTAGSVHRRTFVESR